MNELIELKDELLAAPVNKWMRVPYTQNHHKWWLHWRRYGEHGRSYFFSVASPANRRYTFYATADGRVTGADIAIANGARIASYYASLGDKLDRLDAVIRLTPGHVIDRLFVLLDAAAAAAKEKD